MSDENDELLGMFVQEAAEHLETIEPDLLTLEEKGQDTDPEIVNRLFRGVHSIKGSAGFFGLTAITRLSHTMENLLGKVREKNIIATAAVSDSLLAGLDKLKQMIQDVNNSETVDATAEIAAIEEVLEGNGIASGGPPKVLNASTVSVIDVEDIVEAEQEEPELPTQETDFGPFPFNLEQQRKAVQEAQQHGRRFFSVQLVLEGDGDEKQSQFDNFRSLLESVGELVSTNPDLGKSGNVSNQSTRFFSLLVSTVLEKDLLLSLMQVRPEQIAEVAVPESMAQNDTKKVVLPKTLPAQPAAPQPKSRPTAKPVVMDEEEEMEEDRPRLTKPQDRPGAAAAKAGDAKAGSSAIPTMEETLRVSVSLLDDLINNAGELVLARNQLVRASIQVAQQFPHIAPLVQNLDSITSRIQEKVMQARMQPVSVVFNKFPRIIRDLARKLEKKIDLNIRGGEVELDKSVIEHLSDPLTHMIRNVADHAIEEPQARLSAKKPEAGQVELAAYHENGMVNIALNDDGQGIDAERIKAKALEKGLINEHEADSMGEQEALNLIFAPGLSTAKKISDVSGRGVGMDVVRTNIEKLGGTVHIESKLGKGTRITLKLPLTLAIIPAMIVSSATQRFAIPEVGLIEIVRVTESDRANQIEVVGNAPVLRLRNTLLPLVNLSEILGINKDVPRDDEGQPERRKRLADRRALKEKARAAALNAISEGANDKSRRSSTDRRDPRGLVAYVMVVNVGGNEFGMVVDEVLDSEEIVVKPLPAFFKDNPCFSATTILGDGSVALIIDYVGVVESAKVNFNTLEKTKQHDFDEDRRSALQEKQNIILLETGSGQLMGIVHSMVRRVEKISPTLIEHIGGRPYVRYDRKTFRAVYPDQVLGLEGMHYGAEGSTSDDGNLCMVVPNIPGIQAGLIFTKIIDTREINIDLDTRAITANGLFGSAQIDDHVVLFPDVYAIFDLAGISTPGVKTRVNGTGLRALVVDDTPFLRALTSSYLTGAGFVVEEAEDGHAALNLLKSTEYDLLVTDLNMPMMDGFELVLEIPSTPNSQIPIIATTTSISSQLEQRCSTAGFVSCVSTIDKNKLLRTIASLQG